LRQVYKFGGSSIRSADALRSIASIIQSSKDLSVVVLSATYNTTNELETIAQAAVRSLDDTNELISDLIEKHTVLINELELESSIFNSLGHLESEVHQIVGNIQALGGLSLELMDSLYSIGERCSSLILFHYLKKIDSKTNYVLLDAREVIVTNSFFGSATPLFYDISRRAKIFKNDSVYITQGFIGRDLSGKTTTLGREGSDYTAAILSWAIEADSLIIWKDVEGIYQCDPKIYSDVKILEKLSYEEAELLTDKGAKVLFPRTMAPLKEKGIDLVVKSTFLPEGNGTTIGDEAFNGNIGITARLIDERVIVSLLGSNIYECIDRESFLSSINDVISDVKIFEHSKKVFAISIPLGEKIKGVSALAKCLQH